MAKEKKVEIEQEQIVLTITGENDQARSWKNSDLNDEQRVLVSELQPIGQRLADLEKEFLIQNRNKQFRIDAFMQLEAAKEEVVVDNPEQNPIPEEK
jgi:hypothetical protein|tara:strand:+ start:225 stop:515 length:291 start_codon:yes stop_codon:yes gene_type:complete